MPDGLLPSYRCFPAVKKEGSWALGIDPPTEGSLDRETWNRLIGILTEYSFAGPDTPCLAYYNPLLLGATDFDNLHVRADRLGNAEILYDNPEVGFSPSNLLVEDRSFTEGSFLAHRYATHSPRLLDERVRQRPLHF